MIALSAPILWLIFAAAVALPLPLICAYGPLEDRVRDWRRPTFTEAEMAWIDAHRAAGKHRAPVMYLAVWSPCGVIMP